MTGVICRRCASPNTPLARTCVQCGAVLEGSEAPSSGVIPEAENAEDLCKVGDTINGRYVVLSLIGRGGMGTVYRVRDTVLEEELALKILLPYFVSDTDVVERFINEVRITRKIAHPNIVRVHDIGSMGDCLFISMEFVNGQSLRTILDRMRPNGRLTARQAVYIITQLCIALKYAHRFTIHRDIKPDNIMITRNNHVKLMDFGISKLKDERFSTNDQAVVGTPIYMAPEQLHHAPDVDGRADIYSIGVVLYELLTGKPPVGLFPPASQLCDDVTAELDAIIMKCLEPDREKRFGSAAEVREALRALSDSSHDGQVARGTPVPDSASDALSRAPVPTSVTEALQAFMEEEQLRGGLAERASLSGRTSGMGSESDVHREAGDSSLLEQFAGLAPGRAPAAARPRGAARHFKLFVVLIVLGVLVLAFYGFKASQGSGVEIFSGEQMPDSDVVQSLVQSKISAAGGLTGALELAIKDLSRENSAENREVLESLRKLFIVDVANRVYAIHFNMSEMNSASSDAVHVGQFDSDGRIRALVEEVNREVAQFKFVLTGVDPAEGTVTFRLNNAYSAVESETVKVGDLLQGRFLVSTVGLKAVFLEDTNPRCPGRILVARLMEPVAAE